METDQAMPFTSPGLEDVANADPSHGGESRSDSLHSEVTDNDSHVNVETDDSPSSGIPNHSVIQQVSDSSFRSEFDDFLSFSFPEDSEFSSPGDTNDPFYFESDHVALKGNEDYRHTLKTFIALESQRTAALRDLDRLLELQQKALKDPIRFVQELRSGGSLNAEIPRPQQIAELPVIEWERYTDDVESVLRSLGRSQPMTRQKQRRELMASIRHSDDQQSVPLIKSEQAGNDGSGSEDIRSASFNQPWTVEEQRKLEELLKKYPPERFESRRWAKIAKELPGRTRPQVASRVQKYFIKLARAGLPVPGRMPNIAAYGGRLSVATLHRHQRYNRLLYPRSTFMTSYEPPVYMSDDDNEDHDDDFVAMPSGLGVGTSNGTAALDCSSESDSETIDPCLRGTPEYQQLQALLVLRKRRDNLRPPSFDDVSESFHMKQEPEDECREISGFPRSSYIDPDYASSTTGISNYLDPNYVPPV